MAKNSKLILSLVITGALLLFSKCANQMPPSGGEPDKTPPQIIELYPESGTTNYHENYFEIKFSEYVDKRSAQEAIFISPAMQNILEYDWSGRTLTVYFKDTLKANTTYTVSVGTGVKDVNNSNKMAEPFTFAFSTGDKIHKGKISGRVYDANSDGVMIFAYQDSSNEIDPGKQKPDYISQVGKNGKFTLLGISDGSYKIFAIRDKLRDFKYQMNEDEFGVQYKNILLDDKFNEMNDVDFFLTKEDTVSPNISNVIMKDRNHLLIEFSDKIDSTKLSVSNFYLFDSTANKWESSKSPSDIPPAMPSGGSGKVFPAYVFKGDAKPFQFYIALTDTLEMKDGWVLVSEGITDLNANISVKDKNSITVNNDRDTVSLKLLRVNGDLPADKADYEGAKLTLVFNDAIDINTVKDKLNIVDDKGTNYLFEVARIDGASFDVSISVKLKQSADYTVKLDLKNYVDLSGNIVDSLFQNKFSTSNELDFSGASGNISANDTTQTMVILESAETIKRTYQQKVDGKKNFDFKKVVPGKYLMWGFKDKNKNGKYDFGTITPFKLSEEFKYYTDTLNLRARWPVGEVNIDFQNIKDGKREKL